MSRPKTLPLLQKELQPAAIVLIQISNATMGGLWVGDKLVNNINLFTQPLHANNLCTFRIQVERLYKHGIRHAKMLIHMKKKDLRTKPAMLYLLQLSFLLYF